MLGILFSRQYKQPSDEVIIHNQGKAETMDIKSRHLGLFSSYKTAFYNCSVEKWLTGWQSAWFSVLFEVCTQCVIILSVPWMQRMPLLGWTWLIVSSDCCTSIRHHDDERAEKGNSQWKNKQKISRSLSNIKLHVRVVEKKVDYNHKSDFLVKVSDNFRFISPNQK